MKNVNERKPRPARPDHVIVTDLLTVAEVAAALRVNPKTVARWAQAGDLPAVRTIGGHRRFHARDVAALLHEEKTRGQPPLLTKEETRSQPPHPTPTRRNGKTVRVANGYDEDISLHEALAALGPWS